MNRSLGTAARVTERVLSGVWLVALGAVVGLALWSHVATLVVVAGGSMEPAIPRGSLIEPEPVDAMAIEAGDVVTVRADNGVLVTHRVVRIADLPSGLHLELQGDANESPDPVLVSTDRVLGRVELVVPGAGYLLTMLTTWTGILAIVALFAASLVGLSLLEDLAAAQTESPTEPAGTAPGRAHAPR